MTKKKRNTAPKSLPNFYVTISNITIHSTILISMWLIRFIYSRRTFKSLMYQLILKYCGPIYSFDNIPKVKSYR